MADMREVNRKLWWASILVFITVFSIVMDRLTGCSRGAEKEVVFIETPPTAAPTEEPPPIGEPEDTLLQLDEIEQAMLEDASRADLNQADRENYRYLVLSDMFNEGHPTDGVPAQGIQKAINQLSSERFLARAIPIDVEQSIYRIDLRDYFGNRGKVVWQRLEKDVPIKGVLSRTIRGQTLSFLTQSVNPWLHARNFAAALTAETYYDIVGIPLKLADFYKVFVGVVPQVDFDARDPGTLLVGTLQSVIAQNDRLMWRLDSGRNGPVYQTFDVDDRLIGAEQNLQQNPFVAEVNPVNRRITQKVFKHAASETISTLPNGMLAWGLWNAAGIRQNAAPQTVVTNTRAVALGLSSEIRIGDCSGCHQSGYIAIRDEIGAHIKGSGDFNAAEKALGELFYKRQATVDAFMAQDNSAYTKALAELGIAAGPDPVNEGLLDAIRTGVSAKEAAAFFFLDETDFIERLRGSENAQAEVGAWLRGGSVSFQQFVNSAPQIIVDLNLFVDIE